MMRRKRPTRDASISFELSQSTSKRRIAQAFGMQMVFRILGMVANVLTVTVTTRYLGADLYGALTTAMVFVGLWTSLTELGIGSVIVRNVMSGKASLERLVRINAGMSLAYSLPLLIVASVSGMAIYHDQPEVVEMVLIISTSLVLSTISSCFQPVFVATLRFAAVAVSDFCSRIATLVCTLVLAEQQGSVQSFAVVQVMPAVVVLLIQGVAASRIVNCLPVFAVRESWDLLRESLPQTGVLIIGVLYWRADGVILSLRSSMEEVGVYGLAYTLAFTISVLPSFFGASTLSAMTQLYAENRAKFASFVSGSIELMLFVGMPIAFVGLICAPHIVDLVGSADFVDRGGPALGLLLFAASVAFVTGVLSQALFAAHDQVFLLRLNVVNLAINVVANVLLAPTYGAIGAGSAMLLTEVIGLIVANWRLARRTGYRTPWTFTLRLSAPVALACVVAFNLRDGSVVITLAVAAAAYLAANLLIGPVTIKRLKALINEMKKAQTSADENHGGAT